ncbi:nuclear transport factor 2 family protein [Kribbella sp. NBC_01484]|uniref:nuclear transport factor 2 family protein n=1 Tax=Kribbella sp. NBC_01484 TaxID=2903579 RepID=UPI002E2EEF3F|nr:nuclear transport factor 2 family protein [Kribbella sp. NBC_01484]
MRSPLDVLELRRQYIVARDFESFAGLFAADGVIELPFAVDGLPARLEGRAAIREFSLNTSDRPVEIIDLRVVQLHQTTDSEVVIVELVTEARHTTTGASFEAPCIQVFRIHNGEIKLFRDYIGATTIPNLTT